MPPSLSADIFKSKFGKDNERKVPDKFAIEIPEGDGKYPFMLQSLKRRGLEQMHVKLSGLHVILRFGVRTDVVDR